MRIRRSFLCAGFVLAVACGGAEEAPPTSGVTVSEDGSRVELRDESGAVAVVAPDAGLPKGFPANDVPLPDDATVVTYLVDEAEGGRGYTLHLEVDDVTEVAARHREKLQQAGFAISNRQAASEGVGGFESYQATSPAWEVTVIAAREPGGQKNLMMVNVAAPGAADPGGSQDGDAAE